MALRSGTMKMRIAKYARAASLLTLLLAAPLWTEVSARIWQTGRLAAVEINGQSSRSRKGTLYRDIWWTYTLSLGDRTYSGVSRESPVRMGLKVDSPVRFSPERDRIYFLDPRGKQHVLRIIRQDKKKP